jgi:hypothetical protein
MPHPADHPLAAAAIVRALSNQLQKAKAAGDDEAASAIQAAIDRAQRMVKRVQAHTPPRPSPEPSSVSDKGGWAEIVVDRRQHPRRFAR